MGGRLALHGGGEFQPRDDAFLSAVLSAAAERVATDSPPQATRIVIVPTAARRQRPEVAVATGEAAFDRVAARTGIEVAIDSAMILDQDGAMSGEIAARLATADLIYFTGGDPDIIPTLFEGSLVWQAIVAAHARGSVIVGASAGAMAMAAWTWTPKGGLVGLGLVEGLVVVPHYERVRVYEWRNILSRVAPIGLGYLGLDEQTGILSDGAERDAPRSWHVIGAGGAYWFGPGMDSPVEAQAGDVIEIAG